MRVKHLKWPPAYVAHDASFALAGGLLPQAARWALGPAWGCFMRGTRSSWLCSGTHCEAGDYLQLSQEFRYKFYSPEHSEKVILHNSHFLP